MPRGKRLFLYAICPVAAKCVDGSGLSQNFATMQYAPRDEVLLSGLQRNPLPVNDQGIAALDHDHVFVVVVGVRCGSRSFTAGPKRHLAAICPIEYVTLDSWGGLIGVGHQKSILVRKEHLANGSATVSHR